MIKVYQTTFGGIDTPKEEQGNCFQACIASILEIPLEEAFTNIPYEIVNGGAEGEWFDKFNEWLAERGLGCVAVGIKEWSLAKAPGYHIAQLFSKTLKKGEAHAVVIYNGEVVHDPNPNATALGDLEGVYLFVPLDAAKATTDIERLRRG